MMVAADSDSPGAERFLEAWERGDYEAMHAELTPAAQAEYSVQSLERAYTRAAETVTATAVSSGEVSDEDELAVSDVTLDTNAFGQLHDQIALPVEDGLVDWSPNLVYPGLAANERLARRTRSPERAPILATDGTPLATGPAAARTVDPAGAAVVGEVGTPTRVQAADLAVHGFPPGSLTGTSGLELAWNERLSGQPGGQLVAVAAEQESEVGGGRILASSEPVRGKAVRTTIDPALQQSAVAALGSVYGGVAVLDARDGDVLALSGIAYSAPQPPGSTFKVITTTGALDEDLVSLDDEFPVEVSNSDIGREIANSHDAPCGGTFAQSFADSCNTVFAPLGAELGGEKLVETAERFGFNSEPPLFDDAAAAAIKPPASTIPAQLESSVEVGESAIGQGQVLATPLEMATVSQTIANQGVRMPTPIARGEGLEPTGEPVKVTSPETARTIKELMQGVVGYGTGTAAALPGIDVAGKTGTAELGPAALEPGQELGPDEEPPQETDAWFTAFAPAGDPKIAAAVMVVNSDGDGGTVAAPIVRQIMASYFGVA
jgi:penicillin-binding protein A